MSQDRRNSGPLSYLWSHLLQASRAAVAAQYAAPWTHAEASNRRATMPG